MSLVVGATVTVGGSRYERNSAVVRVTLGLLPTPNRARVTLPQPGGTATPVAAPGDDATLELDGGEGSTVVLTGQVQAVRHDWAGTTVTVADAGARLAAVRPGSTADRQDAGGVVASLASAAGIDVGDSELDLGLAAFVADQHRTAAEHVALLATLGGCLARVDADGRLSVVTRPAGPPDVSLRWGREIAVYDVRRLAEPAASRIRVGSGSAGSPDADGALRPSTSPLRGDAGGPAADTILEPTPLLRSPGAVATASAADSEQRSAESLRLHATCFLSPALRPGVVVAVAGVPDGLDAGPWLLQTVTHHVSPHGGGRTHVTGDSVGAGGGGSGLLAAALGAVGGLL
jgi:hypothetical protein